MTEIYCERCGQLAMLSQALMRGLCARCRLQTQRLEVGEVDVFRLRERIGATQASLARALHVSKRSVTRWESGERQAGAAALLVFALELASVEAGLKGGKLRMPSEGPSWLFWAGVFQIAHCAVEAAAAELGDIASLGHVHPPAQYVECGVCRTQQKVTTDGRLSGHKKAGRRCAGSSKLVTLGDEHHAGNEERST